MISTSRRICCCDWTVCNSIFVQLECTPYIDGDAASAKILDRHWDSENALEFLKAEVNQIPRHGAHNQHHQYRLYPCQTQKTTSTFRRGRCFPAEGSVHITIIIIFVVIMCVVLKTNISMNLVSFWI